MRLSLAATAQKYKHLMAANEQNGSFYLQSKARAAAAQGAAHVGLRSSV